MTTTKKPPPKPNERDIELMAASIAWTGNTLTEEQWLCMFADGEDASVLSQKNATYIAAVSPDVVLRLLDMAEMAPKGAPRPLTRKVTPESAAIHDAQPLHAEAQRIRASLTALSERTAKEGDYELASHMLESAIGMGGFDGTSWARPYVSMPHLSWPDIFSALRERAAESLAMPEGKVPGATQRWVMVEPSTLMALIDHAGLALDPPVGRVIDHPERPNQMDAPGGPRCGCGRSSVHESGCCAACAKDEPKPPACGVCGSPTMPPQIGTGDTARVCSFVDCPTRKPACEAYGTMECPICGRDRIHTHTRGEIDRHERQPKPTPESAVIRAAQVDPLLIATADRIAALTRDRDNLIHQAHVSAESSRATVLTIATLTRERDEARGDGKALSEAVMRTLGWWWEVSECSDCSPIRSAGIWEHASSCQAYARMLELRTLALKAGAK